MISMPVVWNSPAFVELSSLGNAPVCAVIIVLILSCVSGFVRRVTLFHPPTPHPHRDHSHRALPNTNGEKKESEMPPKKTVYEILCNCPQITNFRVQRRANLRRKVRGQAPPATPVPATLPATPVPATPPPATPPARRNVASGFSSPQSSRVRHPRSPQIRQPIRMRSFRSAAGNPGASPPERAKDPRTTHTHKQH